VSLRRFNASCGCPLCKVGPRRSFGCWGLFHQCGWSRGRLPSVGGHKTKQGTEHATCLEDRLSSLQQELIQKDKFFVDEVEVYKGEAAQALLVGFEVAVEQASSVHPSLDFSQLGPCKRIVKGKLIEE